MKALLDLPDGDRHLPKQPRAQPRAHGGGLGLSSLPAPWGPDAAPTLWGSHDKAGPGGVWEESSKSSGGSLARAMGLKGSRSSPALGDGYGGPGRARKKTDEEEKLLRLLQGLGRPQDGFTQWCEQMLHALSASSHLDVPTAVAFLKEVESPYDVHDCIRSYLGDTLEAKEFAKQFLERRAKQKEALWLGGTGLPSFPPPGGAPAKVKRRPVMIHSDPSILGYSLHGPAGEVETIEDY
ncbi:hypothetical protein Y1Q_0000227 [Alligator mississippiensis]|uniref:Uncharacterized protein n=1 Tax=Alligator mississippiensis TaxID=8496 RepID=A0A151M8T1_ALLMI|nr:hypothetical protein Y1Q_0000227 [Alligator mississippiensis]